MRIFITGGAGCLGSNLVEHWLPQGHEILVLDNFVTGRREVVPAVRGLRVIEGSVADAPTVDRCFSEFRPEVVVHAAASYKDPDAWEEDARTNVLGSIHVAHGAARHGTKKLINFQTALCYGTPQQVPVPVDSPTAPFTSYGISKTAGERFMLLGSVPPTSLRISNVTGPRLAIGPIPTFYKRLKAGQNCFCTESARDFLDIQDFLDLMDSAIRPDAPVGIFNVGRGEAHTISEVFSIVAAHLGIANASAPTRPVANDDVPVMSLDPSLTTRDFGWSPRISFNEAIRRQLAWYDQYGVTETFSHLK